MVSNRQYSWKTCFYALVLSALPALAWPAGEPRSLEVHVLNRQSGDAIAAAAVCLGTSAKPDQFGARRTNADGIVRFEDVAPNTLLVTASKPGVQGIRQLLEPVSQNRVVVLKVASGGGGPQCDAPAAVPTAGAGAGGLTIDRVMISDVPEGAGNDEVLVSLEVSGKANQVRASEHADFAGANWQELRSPLTLKTSPGKGEKHLYVQVRHLVQAEGATIEEVSPVERVRYLR